MDHLIFFGWGGWDFCLDRLFFSHVLWTRIFFLIYFIQEHFIGKILFFNKAKWWVIFFFQGATRSDYNFR